MLPLRKIAPKPPTDTSTAGAAGSPPADPVSEGLKEPSQSDVDEASQSFLPLRSRPNGSSNPLGQADEAAGSSRRDSSVPGQSRPLKRKSGSAFEVLQPMSGLVMTPTTQALTSGAQAVPAAGSNIPGPPRVVLGWRRETGIDNSMTQDRYDDKLDARWGTKRLRVDDDAVQADPENDKPTTKALDDVQDNKKNDEVPIKAQDDVLDNLKTESPPFKTEDGVDAMNSASPLKTKAPQTKKEQDEDAITPAPPFTNPPQTLDYYADTANIDPNGILTLTGSSTRPNPRTYGVDIADSLSIMYPNHPSIPPGLQIRFLKSGSPLTDDLVYVLPQTLYADLVAQFNAQLCGYYIRFLAGVGRFGSVRDWELWPDWQNFDERSPHACAHCVDVAFVGGGEGDGVPRCSWLDEGGALACRQCAEARVFCIVNIGGCPTVLRNPVGRTVGGVDAIGVARE
jgi:hypothetical protein